MYDKKLAKYMRKVFDDLQQDDDVVRAMRRIHIKEVHLQRKGDSEKLRLLKKSRRLIW